MVNVIFIGDPHIQTTNIPEVDIFIERLVSLVEQKKPDFICIAGDVLHTHERLHTLALNKAYEFINKMRNLAKTYLLVGNHDMCLGKNTPVLLWNGTVKMSQNISNGDILIGDDGTPRTVNYTCSGMQEMFLVKQSNNDDYIVSKNHILSLKYKYHKKPIYNSHEKWVVNYIYKNKIVSQTFKSENDAKKFLLDTEHEYKDDIIDISIKDFNKLSTEEKKQFYGFKSSDIQWEKKDTIIDPYILGMWLINGEFDGKTFYCSELKTLIYFCKYLKQYNQTIRHINKDTFIITEIQSSEYNYKCDTCNKNNRENSIIFCASFSDINDMINKNETVIEKYLSTNSICDINNTELLTSLLELKSNLNLLEKNLDTKTFQELLEIQDIFKQKDIPSDYIINDKLTRIRLLNGIIDSQQHIYVSDGKSVIITHNNLRHIFDKIIFLCRSLGLYCSKIQSFGYSMIHISGNIDIIRNFSHENNDIQKYQLKNIHNNDINLCLSNICVTSVGNNEYYGFSVDGNNRFLLGDFTVTHNCNNQQFLTDNHWMNGMKEWKNLVVVDKVEQLILDDKKFIFVPYVPPGRFQEALHTLKTDFLDTTCIFAHQEFYGCKMGAIISVEGDKWPVDYPNVISGHIHSKQSPQKNIYYSGSAMQNAFGESEKNIIAFLTFDDESSDFTSKIITEIDLLLPRKKIVYMDVEDIDDYKMKNTDDKLKLTLSGNYDQFKALKKTKKYKEMLDSGVKVVFKPKKITKKSDTLTDKKNDTSENGNSLTMEDMQTKEIDFKSILLSIVNEQKNPSLLKAYELVINGTIMNKNDVIFL